MYERGFIMLKPVVVVVDDQSFICDLADRMLRSEYDVRPFTSESLAVKYIRENPVDLVFLDYEMPNMTGYEVLMDIRSNKKTSDLPVIFITGNTSERLETEMRERGATDYILKPINQNNLSVCLKKHLVKS